MWIFISRLPKETRHKDVFHIVNQALKPGWLLLPITTRTHIQRCELMRIVDRDTGERELHGLAEIEPCRMVPGIIERLNDTLLFRDKPLFAHQYHHRSPSRDRRTKHKKTAKERRHQDRRRLHLSIDMVHKPKSHSVSGYQQIHF